MVVAFFAVSFYSGIVAYDDFQTAISTDAGIITQAVASTTFSHNAPFFESFDCMLKDRCSFLLVHPSFVLYAAVPFYAVAPSTITLFALRSALVAISAVPLYWLTQQVTRSSGKALLAAGLFLVWAPSILGDAFSLHLEALLPLELFSLVALWQAGRYRLGLGVAAISFLTFEIYPIFTFLVGVFFLFPYVERAVRSRWTRWRNATGRRKSVRSVLSGWASSLRSCLRLRDVRYSVVLMLSSVAAYFVLTSFMNVWGYEVLSVASPATHPGISGVFYDSSTPSIQPLGTIFTSAQTVSTAEYWLILYALVAFLPLLSPRALILSVPWIGYTFLTDSSRFTTIGWEYSMIAAAPIFIGLAYGLRRVPSFWSPEPATSEAGETSVSGVAPNPIPRRGHTRGLRTVWAGVLVVVVVANFLLMPINPLLTDLGVKPGAPFTGAYFDHSLEPNPAIVWAERMVAAIPIGATILAPAAYFSLVANYPHAYVFNGPYEKTSELPFNVSSGPDYVLLEPSSFTKLGTTLETTLSNPQAYGMRGYVGCTTGGPLLLYEKSYSLPAALYGPPLPQTNAVYTPGHGIEPGPAGRMASNLTSPSGSVIESLAGFNRTGMVWSVYNAFFPPGNYTLHLIIALTATSGKVQPSQSVLRILGRGFGQTLINTTLAASALAPGQWTNFSFNVSTLSPVPEMSFGGYLLDAHAAIAVASVAIEPDPDS